MQKILVKLSYKEMTKETKERIDKLMEEYSDLDEETLEAMDENLARENNEPVEVEIIDYTRREK